MALAAEHTPRVVPGRVASAVELKAAAILNATTPSLQRAPSGQVRSKFAARGEQLEGGSLYQRNKFTVVLFWVVLFGGAVPTPTSCCDVPPHSTSRDVGDAWDLSGALRTCKARVPRSCKLYHQHGSQPVREHGLFANAGSHGASSTNERPNEHVPQLRRSPEKSGPLSAAARTASAHGVAECRLST